MPNIPAIDESRIFTDPKLFTASNRNKKNITHIVFHHTGYQDPDFAVQIYKDYGVSTHYLIDFNGNILRLVHDRDIAYHAGISRWRSVDGLNKCSIGIEFLTPDPYQIGFSDKQVAAGIELCKYLMCKYQIDARNIVGHSDIAYDKNTDLLGRKQDPSYLFPWEKFAKAGIGFYPNCQLKPETSDKVLFQLDDSGPSIVNIRQRLSKIGYKINITKDAYDEELARAMRCFNRHFNPKLFETDPDYPEALNYTPQLNGTACNFWLSSELQLSALCNLLLENSLVKKNPTPKSNPGKKNLKQSSNNQP